MPGQPSSFSAFLAELKRRRVFRVAIVYAGVAFILVQIVDGTFDPMGIPVWVSRLIILLLVLGFPIAVALAWAFDITDKGIVRTKGKAQAPATSRRPILTNWTLGIVAALAIIVAAWSLLREPSPGAPLISSIAVLPLDNLGGDPEQVYFVEGMHEAIITNLNRLSALKVISRTSAMRYKDTDKLMPEIARELNVDALVEGSVLKAGNRVRITAQLIHGASDEHLWSNDYEGDLNDILLLQKTVARAIAKEIGLALKPEEEAYLASAPQVNPEAYNLYLKGWHFRSLENRESMPKAVEYLEQAVALDSTFAQAWVALWHSYLMMAGDVWEFDYAITLMEQVLDKAMDLDPNLPEAHVQLGIYQFFWKIDIAAAEASFRQALELDPDNVYALYEYGLFLLRTGRPDEGLAMEQRAQELDPLNPLPLRGIAMVYSATCQYDKALEYWQAVLDLSPGHDVAPGKIDRTKREILMRQGRYADAAAEAEKAYTESADMDDFFQQLRAEWALGNKDKVYSVRDSLRSSGWEQEYPFGYARLYAIMGGERDKALDLLERAYEDTTIDMGVLVYFRVLDSLRAEPRFKALLQKIGLTEVFDQYGQRIR